MGGSAGQRPKCWRAHAAAHVLFGSGDAGRCYAGYSGTRRTQDLSTTHRYMHLSPAAIEGAIRLMDQRGPVTAVATLWQRPISLRLTS